MNSYCKLAQNNALHGQYHDNEYGFPTDNNQVLFERLSLEIMQAGLSWSLILQKRSSIRQAFSNFNIAKVAKYDTEEIGQLLKDKKIIRNKLKILSIIENAKRIELITKRYSGFNNWIQMNHPLKRNDWVKLFKATFKFTGKEITGEFLMSIGYLPGAHSRECKVYAKVEKLRPPWMDVLESFYTSP